ncbi:MAG: hypothetical protein CSA66_05115 [Proteobacteria bacterium]|nr:MAG: hypothetical protein CSA66_05115 [Pseudomonadota bacterium]
MCSAVGVELGGGAGTVVAVPEAAGGLSAPDEALWPSKAKAGGQWPDVPGGPARVMRARPQLSPGSERDPAGVGDAGVARTGRDRARIETRRRSTERARALGAF